MPEDWEKFERELIRSKLYWADYKNGFPMGDRSVFLTQREFIYWWLLYAGITTSQLNKYYQIKEKNLLKRISEMRIKIQNNQYTSDFFLRLFERVLKLKD